MATKAEKALQNAKAGNWVFNPDVAANDGIHMFCIEHALYDAATGKLVSLICHDWLNKQKHIFPAGKCSLYTDGKPEAVPHD